MTMSEAEKYLETMRLGPSSYDPAHTLTERRADFGIVKMRENYFTIEEEDAALEGDMPLNINYDYDKPQKLVFRYYSPTKVKPTHTPDKENHPEKWKYYDYDLNAVREEVAKQIDFAQGLSKGEFRDHEIFLELLTEHIKRHDKRPAVGHYDPERPETKIEYDFGKLIPREPYVDPVSLTLIYLYQDFMDDEDKEGDVLVLEPDKPKPRLGDYKFDKMVTHSFNILVWERA